MSWSHAGRCRDEAGCARLVWVAAPQAATGQCQVLTRVRAQPDRVFELKHSSCDAKVRISDDVRGLPPSHVPAPARTSLRRLADPRPRRDVEGSVSVSIFAPTTSKPYSPRGRGGPLPDAGHQTRRPRDHPDPSIDHDLRHSRRRTLTQTPHWSTTRMTTSPLSAQHQRTDRW